MTAVCNNCPINPLIRRGASEVVAIRTGSNMPFARVVDKTVKLTVVEPSEDLGGTIDLRKAKVDYNIKLGYFDALRAIDNLAGVRYYLQPVTVAETIRFAEGLGDEAEKTIRKLLKTRGSRHTLISKAMEVAKKELSLPEDADATQSLLALLEYAAGENGVEKFKVYTLPEFFGEIKRNMQPKPENDLLSYEIAKAIITNYNG